MGDLKYSKRAIHLTGYKFKCVELDYDSNIDMAKWNSRFTIGQYYDEVVNAILATKRYVGLVDDFGEIIYVERSQFQKLC